MHTEKNVFLIFALYFLIIEFISSNRNSNHKRSVKVQPNVSLNQIKSTITDLGKNKQMTVGLNELNIHKIINNSENISNKTGNNTTDSFVNYTQKTMIQNKSKTVKEEINVKNNNVPQNKKDSKKLEDNVKVNQNNKKEIQNKKENNQNKDTTSLNKNNSKKEELIKNNINVNKTDTKINVNAKNQKTLNLTEELKKSTQKPIVISHPRKTNKNVKIHIIKQKPKVVKPRVNLKEIQERKERKNFEDKIAKINFKDILNFKLLPREVEEMEEEILTPCKFYFMIMVGHPTHKINFELKGPDNKKITKNLLTQNQLNYFYYEYNATNIGKYSFTFKNIIQTQECKVTFGLTVLDPNDQIIKTESFDEIGNRIENISSKINELRLKANLYVKKMEGHKHSVLKQNKAIIAFSTLEVIILIIIFIIQFVYLRKLLNKL
ncbi:MAG: emp24/gp25L/p24 family protein [archaeon]|nr:emp24/gp25L/p24 family protein [archaeon]